MKIERHLCDLCGGAIGKKDGYATLEVPDFAALDKKAATPTPSVSGEEMVAFSFRVFWHTGNEPGTKKYDVCRGCCEGLLKARAYIRRAALERMFAQQEEPA